MRKEIVLLMLGILFCGIGAAASDQKSSITVKGSQLTSGVVILDIVRSDKIYTLQCNQGAPDCSVLSNGKYQMLELPKNFGMYDCSDVEIYPDATASPDNAPDRNKKLGEYCLIEK